MTTRYIRRLLEETINNTDNIRFLSLLQQRTYVDNFFLVKDIEEDYKCFCNAILVKNLSQCGIYIDVVRLYSVVRGNDVK